MVDITDVIDSSRSGCSIASVCTIMPPIDTPMTCARVDLQVVEHGDRIGGHVAHRVGAPTLVELGRQAHVAVVEADDEEPLGRELLAPLGPVVDALTAEPVDQQQRGVARDRRRSRSTAPRRRCARWPWPRCSSPRPVRSGPCSAPPRHASRGASSAARGGRRRPRSAPRARRPRPRPRPRPGRPMTPSLRSCRCAWLSLRPRQERRSLRCACRPRSPAGSCRGR